MSRRKSLYAGALSALLVMGISTSVANAQQDYGDRQVGTATPSYHDGEFIKVGHKGRRNTALAVGAIVLGTILYNESQKNNYQGNYNNNRNAHVNWCYNRYRSYRAYDNTFQPYRGPRRQCISPYY